MLQGKRTRRIIAATLLTVMLTNTLAPTVTYALTSGPTAPEATSFEPVDTTDMVNLQSGDFTYNIPLMEVPGPEGGYPLSLSYHAGIQPNEDASWVGLGWTLNPGSISRSVSGYPDDWYSPTNTSHDYWEGGKTSTYKVGVTIGIANTPASVSFGLSFSQDTYRGFGVGMDVGIGGKFGNQTIGFATGTDGYGGYYEGASLHLGVGNRMMGASLGLDVSTDFRSVDAGFTANLQGLGYTMSTTGAKGWSALGYSSSISSTSDPALQTSTKSSGLNGIPVFPGVFLNLGRNKTRYWVDKSTSISTHGSLYASNGWEGSGGQVSDNVAYDTYSLLEDNEDKSIADYSDPTTIQGGAYLDFDMYDVSAQGLGGSMRPYEFVGEALGQNRKDQNNSPKVTYYSPGTNYRQPDFRFIGDFSNTYRQNYPDYANAATDLRYTAPPFDINPIYGNDYDNDGIIDGFANNMLAGSKYIQTGVRVLPSNIAGYDRNARYKFGMIDGFSITNESGVTYHYGLPAYTWGEESYQRKIDAPGGSVAYNRGSKPEAYAYTWYLTTITGPDYVDRNNNNTADEGDWGYYVNFEYGKWSNNYVWRNPATRYNTDEDNRFQNVSMGRKEIYYLNAIRTRTHVALFEKDIRYDGKGVSPSTFNKDTKGVYTNDGEYNVNSSQSLQLKKIYLLNSADAGIVNNNSGFNDAFRPIVGRNYDCSECELAPNVLDKTDVEAVGRVNLESKAIRIIDFKSDYSLCRNTTNSFDIDASQTKLGKLTLNSLSMRGKGGADLMPPTRFEYELSDEDRKYTGGATVTWTNFSTANGAFEVGDMVMIEGSPALFGSVIYKKTLSGNIYTYELLDTEYRSSQPSTANVYATKNPPFYDDGYDSWGLYKSNRVSSIGVNEGQARITSQLSAHSVDAWSLRKIITPLGGEVKIGYESDSYSKAAMRSNLPFAVTRNYFSAEPAGTIGFAFRYSELGGDHPSDFFKPGDQVDFIALQKSYLKSGGSWQGNYVERVLDSRKFSSPVTVNSVDDNNYIVFLQGDDLQYQLFTNKKGYFTESGLIFDPVADQYNIEAAPPAGANLSKNNSRDIYGGGLRVKSLSLVNRLAGITYNTTYDYNIPGSSASSGVTTYEGSVLEKAPFDAPYTQTAFEITKTHYKQLLYKDLNTLYSMAREIPSPGVMYEYVTVENSVKNDAEPFFRIVPGVTQYKFEVYRDNMICRFDVNDRRQQVSSPWGNMNTRNLTLQKFTGSLGLVRRITQYDKKNGKKLKETINHFLHEGLEDLTPYQFMLQYGYRLKQYKYQGFIEERFSEVKEVINQTNSADNGVKATLSAREEFPCISTGQTTVDYVTGIHTNSTNVEYDFYSGAPTKIDETDVYGNRFRTQTKPAYTVPAYAAGMGLKMKGGKNMLTQVAGKNVYKLDDGDNVVGIVSASASIWGNNTPLIDVDGNAASEPDVWRVKSSYSWMPDTKTFDGMTAVGNFVDFNWNAPASSDARWKKTSETSLYDVFSKPLEAKDIDNNYVATHMDYGSKRILTKGSGASYYEIAYSGAEDEGVNQANNMFVKKTDGIITSGTTVAHTGARSLKLGAGGQKGFVYTVSTDKLVPGRKYIAHVWTKPVSGSSANVKLYYAVNGVEKNVPVLPGSGSKTANGWTLLDMIIDGSDIIPGATLTVGCRNNATSGDVYVDDFRFQPYNATTTAYVYDAFSGELTHILDNNNLYMRYEYDAVGRLVRTYREKLNLNKEFKTHEFQYNYGTSRYGNDPVNGTYTKSNCPFNTIAPSIAVNIPGGQYISYKSPDEANAMARAAAQDQANAGTCNLIYARLAFENVYPVGSSNYGDIAVYFYLDAACTQPYNVSNLVVNWTDWFSCDDSACGEESTITRGVIISGTKGYLEGNVMLSSYGTCYCSLDVRLAPGTYNIVF